MLEKIKSVFFLLSFFALIFLASRHYFSEQNIIYTNKSRSSYALKTNKEDSNLPVLKNDTGNIIVYKSDLEEFQKKRKKRIWEELISD